MNLLALFAALIVFVTIAARGADHPTKPRAPGFAPALRLHVEKLALLAVGASAAAVGLSVLAGVEQPPQVVFLMAGTALWMLSHPEGWLAFVLKGKGPGCDQLRPDP